MDDEAEEAAEAATEDEAADAGTDSLQPAEQLSAAGNNSAGSCIVEIPSPTAPPTAPIDTELQLLETKSATSPPHDSAASLQSALHVDTFTAPTSPKAVAEQIQPESSPAGVHADDSPRLIRLYS